MATIASLDVNLGVRSKQFTRELNKAKRDVRSFSKTATAAFKAAAVATTAAATALAGMSRQALLAADNIAKSARNAGLSAEAYQRLAESFRLGGSSAQALVKGNQALLRNIRDLGRGLSTQADAFGTLGLRYRDLRDLSPEQQFLLVRQRLSELTNETQRSAIAQQLFGRAGKEFGTILTENNATIAEQGRRLERLGGVISGDLLGTAEEFNDQIETTTQVIQAQFTSAIIEAIDASTQFRDIDDLIRAVGQGVRSATTAVTDFVRTIIEWKDEILGVVAAWAALRVIMFTTAAIQSVVALVAAVKTFATALRTVTLASIAARAATVGLVALWIAIPTALAAIGVAVYSAAGDIKDALGAAADFIVAKFRSLKLSVRNVILNIKSFFIGLGGTIQEFLTDKLNTFLELVNGVLSYLGREEIELISSDAAERTQRRLQEIESEIMANVAAQEQLQMAADNAAAAVAGSASAAVSAGIQGISDVVSGAAAALGLGGPETPTTQSGGSNETTVPDEVGDQIEEDAASIWQRISEAWANAGNAEGVSLGMRLSDNLSMNLSQAIGQGNFESVGSIFLSTIQSSIQERVTDKLQDVFSGFFDSFFSQIEAGLAGGGGGGGLGGLFSLFGGFFHDGGIVPGREGQEVPIVAQAGEAVLTKEQQQALVNGQVGSQTVNQTLNVTGDVSEATRRAVREMGQEIADSTQSRFRERGVI